MRKKPTLNRGIAALALSASLFLGCQNFLSEDKAVQSAKTSSETAKDMPAKADDAPKPAAEPTTASATPDNTAECKEIYAQMQSAKDPLYGELKNKFGSLNCDITKFSTPFVPPDSATVCKNLRATLAMLDPTSPKYLSYQQEIAAYCADANTPAAPVVAPSTPVAPDNAAECKEIYAQMQTAMQSSQDLLYMELKNKFGSLNCDHSKAAGTYVPPTPPDSATVCKNLRATLATLDPTSPKYASYQQEIAAYCTDANTPAAPIAPSSATTTPVAPDNTAECKEIYAQMQSAKDPLYGELKNKFGGLNCDITKFSTPFVPPDSATVCKNLRATLAMLDPTSPKYLSYQQEIAAYCADANTPAAPIAPTSTPAAPDNAAECKKIYAEMQTAKDPLYGELKMKFTDLKCDMSQAAGPVVPPDSATVCKNFQASLAQMDPSSSKYPLYLEQIAIFCTAKP